MSVFAVRCPAAACRKYMLVEVADRGSTVPCLICKAPIRVPGGSGGPPAAAPSLDPTQLPVAKLLPPDGG